MHMCTMACMLQTASTGVADIKALPKLNYEFNALEPYVSVCIYWLSFKPGCSGHASESSLSLLADRRDHHESKADLAMSCCMPAALPQIGQNAIHEGYSSPPSLTAAQSRCSTPTRSFAQMRDTRRACDVAIAADPLQQAPSGVCVQAEW